MNEDVIKLIKYRLSRAEETFEDAKILFKKGSYNSCINRIYYAMFYSVLSLLRTKDLMASKHSGVRAMFHREFVKSGIVPVEMGKFYDKMFINRGESDYEDFITFKKENVEKFLNKAEEFIKFHKKIIEEKINKYARDDDS